MSAVGIARRMSAITWLTVLSASVFAQPVDGGYRVFRPDGHGPHPAIVFLSGCFGFSPDYAPKAFERRSEELRGRGFVVVWADYIGRRNLKSCVGISKAEVGRDAVAAASWLRAQSDVDAKRITAMGWTTGAGGVLQALADHSASALGFTRVIAFYPNCTALGPWSSPIPVLVLQAGLDNVAPNNVCNVALDNRSGKRNIKIVNYSGAHHGFDIPELPTKMDYPFGTMGYHPQAAAAASEEVQRFLEATR